MHNAQGMTRFYSRSDFVSILGTDPVWSIYTELSSFHFFISFLSLAYSTQGLARFYSCAEVVSIQRNELPVQSFARTNNWSDIGVSP